MTTYLIKTSSTGGARSIGSSGDFDCDADSALIANSSYGERIRGLNEKTNRLIDWNVEMLLKLLRDVVARRSMPSGGKRQRRSSSGSLVDMEITTNPLEEVREIISLPDFDQKVEQADQTLLTFHKLSSKSSTTWCR